MQAGGGPEGTAPLDLWLADLVKKKNGCNCRRSWVQAHHAACSYYCSKQNLRRSAPHLPDRARLGPGSLAAWNRAAHS